MKILAVADVESRFFYDYYTPGKLREFDLILACGDLGVSYLEFLVTMARCPLLYVHGNHDEAFRREPEGCICIDDKIFEYQGIRIMGLGGAYRYRKGKYMYTERQMERRIQRLWLRLHLRKGVDILVTHAPARYINDFDSLSHRGFECFGHFLDQYQPKVFVHGHIHKSYGINIPQKTEHSGTMIINAYNYCIFEI